MTTTKQYFKVKNGLEFPRQDALTVTDDGGPSIRPSLLLDFAKTKKLDPRITFSRPTTATYYDGKTVAKAEENLLLDSQDFKGSWGKTNITVTANAVTAPDGSVTASKIIATATAGYHGSTRGCTITQGLPYTLSVYAKTGEYTKLHISDGSYAIFNAAFDLNGGTVISSGGTGIVSTTVVGVGNGWYRCSVTFNTAFFTSVQTTIVGYPDTGATVGIYGTQYTGDGTSGIYIWGAQLEQRSSVTAYTPTTTAPITNYIPVLQTAAANVARFDHDPVTGESKGLLIEEARTNLVASSENFRNWNVYQQTQTESEVVQYQNACIAPNGTITATKVVESSSSGAHRICMLNNVSMTAGSYTFSVYAKAAERSWLFIQNPDAGGGNAYINISTGAIGTLTNITSATATNVGNGWYRVSITGPVSSTTSAFRIFFGVANGDGGVNYTGNGVSGVYLWGAQLENSSFATSYIPTALTYTGRGSTATYKAADGLIRTAPANVARYEPNASGGSNLLLEPAASNLMSDTSNIISWNGYNPTYRAVTLSPISAPDGSMTATYVYRFNTTGTSSVFKNTSGSGTGTYTASLYYKADTQNALNFTMWFLGSTNQSFNLVFNPITNVVSMSTFSSYSITEIGGGWYRVAATATGTYSANTQVQLEIYQQGNAGGVHLWGAQLEAGSTATSYIPSTETHTGRSSTATYYDSTGTIRTAASGQPRYTYNPSLLTAPPTLLLEAQATNLMPNSQTLTNWNVAGFNVTTDGTTAPDGTTTAEVFVEAVSGGYHYMHNGGVVAMTAGKYYTMSFFAKGLAGNGYNISSYCSDGTANTPSGYWSLLNGSNTTSGTSSGALYVGNGWWRCWFSILCVASGSPPWHFFGRAQNQYTGDGTTAFAVWGYQVEEGIAPTSYIPTSGSTVTRAADTSTSAAGSRAADVYSSSQVTRSAEVASMTGTNFSSWYRADEGTLYATGAVGASTNYGPFFTAQVSGGSTRIQLAAGNAAIISNGSTSADMYASTTSNVLTSVSTAYKTNDYAFAKDGVLVSQDSSGQVPQNLAYSIIGKFDFGGAQSINGTVKRIAYYPKRLSNTELQSITS